MVEPRPVVNEIDPDPLRRRPVLAATDFSEPATAAVQWAASVARDHEAPLLLVHAVHLHGPMSDYLPSPPDVEESLQAAASQQLARQAEELRGEGLLVEEQLAVGIASESVTKLAHEWNPLLVVIGARGIGGLGHLLLGSTAERIVQHVPHPVLTVHAGDDVEHRPVRSILVPTDFSADATGAAQTAERLLASRRPARLVLLHAYHLPVEYTAYGTIPTGLSFREDVGVVAESKLAEIAADLRREGLEVDSIVREGYPPEVIVEVAAEVEADVIAMGTHGRSGLKHLLLGSNAERVIHRAGCPVLTVRHPDSA